jgi:Tfp pilus assembly pilus retraction ATPase PilT
VRRLAELPRGLVLVTGSTGSGKSTTLAAMVNHINSTRAAHIVTLEDPIEFVHDDLKSIVTQREVGSDTRDFSVALRHVVRESPDVILIGEMRDAETMNVALSAALTGHLVLSSLHTIDASQTLQRILSYYPEHLRDQVCMDLSLCLQGVVAQRLVPRADGEGRVAACEVLLGTPAVRKLVREQRVDELGDVMDTAGEGMIAFNRALVQLYERKLITLDIGAAYATNPDEFRLNAQGMERGVAGFAAEHEALPALGSLDMRTLLQIALRYGASDLHMVTGSPPIFRIHGKLRRLEGESLSASDARRLLFSLLSHKQRETFELDRELDFALTVTGQHRFRVNAHYQRGTIAVALRLIPNSIPDINSLGLPPVVIDLAQKPHGLVLVTGPTGSGKSTTLAAMVDRVNHLRACHIITVEDPIEFVHHNRLATIEQREVGADTRGFAQALKFILRQDPDVILIGEMRDTGDHLRGADGGGDGAPRARDAAHQRRAADRRPHRGRLPAASAVSDSGSARGGAGGGGVAAAARAGRRAGPRGGLRGAGGHRGGAGQHPRGEVAPAPVGDGDELSRRHGHDGPLRRRAREGGPREHRGGRPLHAQPARAQAARGDERAVGAAHAPGAARRSRRWSLSTNVANSAPIAQRASVPPDEVGGGHRLPTLPTVRAGGGRWMPLEPVDTADFVGRHRRGATRRRRRPSGGAPRGGAGARLRGGASPARRGRGRAGARAA